MDTRLNFATSNYRLFSSLVEKKNSLSTFLNTNSLESMTPAESNKIAMLAYEVGEFDVAKQFYKKSLATIHESPNAVGEVILMMATIGLARIDVKEGNINQSLHSSFLDLKEKSNQIPPESANLAEIKYLIEKNLGVIYLQNQDYIQAELCFSIACDIANSFNLLAKIPLAKSYLGLTQILNDKNCETGFLELNEARALFPAQLREDCEEWACHRRLMGTAYQKTGNFIAAITELVEALRLYEQGVKKVDSDFLKNQISLCQIQIGENYLELGSILEAEQFFTKAREHYQNTNNHQKLKELNSIFSKFSKNNETTAVMVNIEEPKSLPIKNIHSSFKNKYIKYSLGGLMVFGIGLFAYQAFKKNTPVPDLVSPRVS